MSMNDTVFDIRAMFRTVYSFVSGAGPRRSPGPLPESAYRAGGDAPPFWSLPLPDVLGKLDASENGLSSETAEERLERYGPNSVRPRKRLDSLSLFLAQFKSPIILLLLFSAVLSSFLGDTVDSLIIFAIVLASGLLGFWQERGAAGAMEKLLAIVRVKAAVLRDGKEMEVPVEDIVPGDVVILNAGDIIPGDARILESKDLFVNEATLTGETFPAEKRAGDLPADTPLARRASMLYMGTSVVSGSARAVTAATGPNTEFGEISRRLKLRPPETEFELGIRRFGYILLEVTLVLVVSIFAINVYFTRPVLDSFLFALSLAVGLTPQLLPAIISINLARGAKRMARSKVIVKRLASIENFGSMNVLCADKTGTITEGVVHLHAALDIEGGVSERVLFHAWLNACFQSGYVNPIDEAIRTQRTFDLSGWRKLDEEPYDFVRKRLSILAEGGGGRFLVTKGALSNVLEVCSRAERPDGSTVDLEEVREEIERKYGEWSVRGYRVLGVAFRDMDGRTGASREDETEMTFLGYLSLLDPPREGVADIIGRLGALGVSLKIITGDNRLVAANIGGQVGIPEPRVLSGADMHRMGDDALRRQADSVDIFAEVEPNQKERIILALKKAGNVVGFLGDGINDASALHAADVGISVDSAADVAKEAADIVLLEKDLGVLVQGVREGRMTFANTLKYVFMATSANFGNMFSMAGVSLFLPFLPLLPKQVLLTNLLTDFPETTIATDSVDPELVEKPRRWDVRFIRNFMLVFGPVSSIFDFATFGALLFLLHAGISEFRTGWFTESVISAALIVLVVRTRRIFIRSRPSAPLLGMTLLVVAATLALPYTPLAPLFGFVPLPPVFLLLLAGIVALYIIAAEIAKRWFYRRR